MSEKATDARQAVSAKRDGAVSAAQEAAHDSAGDAGRRVSQFVNENRGTLVPALALESGCSSDAGARDERRVQAGRNHRGAPGRPIVGKRIFEAIWSVIDDQDAPEPRYRETAIGKLVLALALEGAIFRVLRGLADHGARHGFARLTGEWPGEERPEPKEIDERSDQIARLRPYAGRLLDDDAVRDQLDRGVLQLA